MELFPVLPRDIGLECLTRVWYENLPEATSVCKGWRDELIMPDFLKLRKVAGRSQLVMVVAQERIQCETSKAHERYCLTLLELKTGQWSELPDTEWLTKYRSVACVGSELVVIGGQDMSHNPSASKSVYIYNFITGEWRRGADMPGEHRMYFGCGSDDHRWIYIAGGKGVNGKIQSAMAYDVKKDEWACLPDMSFPRSNSKVMHEHGKVHVVGGCDPNTTQEIYDISTGKWDDPKQVLEENTLLFSCVYGDDGKMYTCDDHYIKTQKGNEWHPVAKLPSKMSVSTVTAWERKLLVIGWTKQEPQVARGRLYQEEPNVGQGWSYSGDQEEDQVAYSWSDQEEDQVAYVLDLKTYQWTKLKLPKNYMGTFESCYCLEI